MKETVRLADALLPLRTHIRDGHLTITDAAGYFVLLLEPELIRDLLTLLDELRGLPPGATRS